MTHPRTTWLLLLFALVAAASVALFALGLDHRHPLVYPGPVEDLVEPGEPPAPAPQPLASRTELRLVVTPVARILPAPRRPACRLVRADGSVVPAAVAWVAGSAAVPAPGVEAVGRQLVRFTLAGGDDLYRVVSLAADVERVDVDYDGPFRLEGRVVDGDGAPIAGARPWCAGRTGAVSGADGKFAVDGLRGRLGLPLVLSAPGRADRFDVVDLPVPGSRDFVLDRGVDLRIRLSGVLPTSARPTVHMRSAGDGDTRTRHYPFFWSVLEPRHLGADGSCLVQGVPEGVALEVLTQHGCFASNAPTRVPRTAAGATVFAAPRIGIPVRGTVTHADGTPAAGALVVIRPPHQDLLRHRQGALVSPAMLLAASHQFTARDGTFEVARPDGAAGHRILVLGMDGPGLEQEIRRNGSIDGVEFTLPAPGPVARRPVLRIVADRAVRLRLQFGNGRDRVVELGAEQVYPVELRGPAVLDVRVVGEDRVEPSRRIAVREVFDLRL